ncbi:pentapeptide repeat-containing protein [Streptomyces sp. NPDC102282]|uniref:pentapeptide repeat-containing protein n=1 Tax=Streptomyces sp. NPDC102282 TaxID=3366154 RepID=UPI003810F1F1
MALIAAGALGWVIYHYAYDYFAQAAAEQKPPKPVNINDVLKAAVTALTLIGAVLAGLYAYRKQLLAEGDAHRADASQLAERYTTAAEQLGHDQAAVRLAGVYALARLADDWAEQRQVCIDVLCAYLRMPYEPDSAAAEHKAGEREVRQTIIRVIRDHLQEPGAPTAWCEQTFDFTGAIFDGGSFSKSHFRGTVTFADATFGGGTVTFADAAFGGGVADFSGATFGDGVANFSGATFGDGTVDFSHAEFSGGTLDFRFAAFGGGTVDFSFATFSDGMVIFYGAAFSGGMVGFRFAAFSGGMVTFDSATFSGGSVTFDDATFSGGTVGFRLATFSGGTVAFDSATFSGGTVTFDSAMSNGGAVTFDSAEFDGTLFHWGPFPVPADA